VTRYLRSITTLLIVFKNEMSSKAGIRESKGQS